MPLMSAPARGPSSVPIVMPIAPPVETIVTIAGGRDPSIAA
jgi:hypothetical protein